MATADAIAGEEHHRARRLLPIAAAVITLLLAAPLVLLIPPGEAPDEPAHLAYVDHLLRERVLPPLSDARVDGYESFQPPLAYAAMAGSAATAGHEAIGYPFERDPRFRFGGPVRRMFLAPPASPDADRALAAVRAARSANLLWGAIASGATFLLALRIASSAWLAIAAAAPFCLAPQLLFASATATNDALLSALSALALAALARALAAGSAASSSAVSTGAGLALGAKASAAALAPAILLAAVVFAFRRRWLRLSALLLPGLLLTAGWLALNLARAGTPFPHVPTGWAGAQAGTLARLVAEPWWVVQVWVGFWAKLGWFNVPLPMAAYLMFVPATLLAAAGVATLVGRRPSLLAGALALVVVANAALLVVYLLTVDWQPQGRYLLPSLPALAGLATLGLESMRSRSGRVARHLPALAAISLALALAGVLLTLRQAAAVY